MVQGIMQSSGYTPHVDGGFTTICTCTEFSVDEKLAKLTFAGCGYDTCGASYLVAALVDLVQGPVDAPQCCLGDDVRAPLSYTTTGELMPALNI